MKKIAVIGCTGSIGVQTLDVVRTHRDEFTISALSCGHDADALIKYAKEFDCRTLGIYDATRRIEVAAATGGNVFCGDDALTEIARSDADIVVVAVVGMIGLSAVLEALKCKKTVALANKESLVAGGAIVNEYLKKYGGEIRPVDSEHSAVWQCLRGETEFKRIILTASGGPFFGYNGDLSSVTVAQAVAHPNWKMGKKISVDSATMMNKGLEIIEARWLVDTENIDYVIHPESVVHSMVEFADGSIKAQAGSPDMRLPILYAMADAHVEREYKPLSIPMSLRFLPPDEQRFPAPRLAKDAIKAGGNSAVMLNAANEAAVRLFLEGKIKFTEIVDTVARTMDREQVERLSDASSVFDTHNRIYNKIYFN